MERFKKILDNSDAVWGKINTGLLWMFGSILTFIVLITVSDVFMRYVFLNPIKGTLNLCLMFIGWVIFLPFAYALVTGTHVRVSAILIRLPPKARLGCEIFAYICLLTFFAIFTYGAWNFFWHSFLVKEYMLAEYDLPKWFLKLSMFVGCFFIAALSIFILAKLGISIKSSEKSSTRS